MKTVRVGVGTFVSRDGRILLGKRKGSHGAGEWSLPGGHLKFNETIANCAIRETREETGIEINNVIHVDFVTNNIFKKEKKHYVTLYATASWKSGEVRVMEPNRCEKWIWFGKDNLPEPLFSPLYNFFKKYDSVIYRDTSKQNIF